MKIVEIAMETSFIQLKILQDQFGCTKSGPPTVLAVLFSLCGQIALYGNE